MQEIIGHNHQILINLELFSWEEVAMSLETIKTFLI
jgi:hypothetical protein